MRSPVRTFLVIAALTVIASALWSAPASAAVAATPLAGRAWTVPVIRLYDTTPRPYREGIDIAIREWNAANVGIRFARTTNRRLAHVVVKPIRYPGQVLGKATLGMTSGAFIGLDTALVAVEHERRNGVITNIAEGAVPETIADTMAHEMGHVLGLDHTTGCSLMLGLNARDTCPPTLPPRKWDCRLIQRKDLVAATRRYGGAGALKPQRYCLLSATRAGAVGAITTGGSTRDLAARLAWRNTANTFGYVVARSAAGGSCPATADAGATRIDLDDSDYTERWGSPTSPTASGRYCYSVWSRNGRGTLTGPARAFVDIALPTVAPVTNLQAVASGSTVQLTWTNPVGTTAVQLYRYASNGTCAVPAGVYRSVEARGGGASATESSVEPGSWTYAAVRSDDPDDASDGTEGFTQFPSAPTCVDVTVA